MPQLAMLMFQADPSLPSGFRWVGTKANGFMFVLSEKMVLSNFTSIYIDKLKHGPNLMFDIPIGRRRNALPPLPRSFPKLPTSCSLKRAGRDNCCVGFGLAAAMHALGDTKWAAVCDSATAAVRCAQSKYEPEVQTELKYFERYFRNFMGTTYDIITPRDPTGARDVHLLHIELMQEHDLAVCQVCSMPHLAAMCTFA